MVMGGGVKRGLGGKLSYWDTLVCDELWGVGGHFHLCTLVTRNCFEAGKEMAFYVVFS